MKFFTARDVLQRALTGDPTSPVTIRADATIQDALTVMFKHDFSQIPVRRRERVSGVVTYKSIARMLKSVPETDIRNQSVRGALVSPRFVDEDQDIFELFDTFAEDEYVLVGTPEELEGILTRYDVFHFLKDEFAPFIQIGDIERSLRTLFRRSFDDLDDRIYQTFSERAEHDESYSIPDSIDHFNFEEYKRFIVVNLDGLPPQLDEDRELVLELLEEVRKNRNALFHFRSSADEIDRDVLDVAHSYFTELVE